MVFYFADINQLIVALRLADYRFVLAGMGITLVWLSVRSIVWRILLQEQASFRQIFFTLNEGYLLNNLLPFRLGEFGRAFLLGRKAGIGFWQVLSSILIERSLDMALAVGLLFSTLPFVVGAAWARQAAIGVGGMMILVFSILYLLARYRDWASERFNNLSARWSLLRKLGKTAVPAFLSGLAILTDIRRFLLSVGWMVLNWLIAILQYYMFTLAFFSDARLVWACFGLGVVAMGVAAPSSPGAVGVLELSLVGALALFDLNPSVSLALAITIHLAQYLITSILGAYALARDGESLIGLYQQVRALRKENN